MFVFLSVSRARFAPPAADLQGHIRSGTPVTAAAHVSFARLLIAPVAPTAFTNRNCSVPH
eukprot:761369-Hanusia_phi.AAC.2